MLSLLACVTGSCRKPAPPKHSSATSQISPLWWISALLRRAATWRQPLQLWGQSGLPTKMPSSDQPSQAQTLHPHQLAVGSVVARAIATAAELPGRRSAGPSP